MAVATPLPLAAPLLGCGSGMAYLPATAAPRLPTGSGEASTDLPIAVTVPVAIDPSRQQALSRLYDSRPWGMPLEDGEKFVPKPGMLGLAIAKTTYFGVRMWQFVRDTMPNRIVIFNPVEISMSTNGRPLFRPIVATSVPGMSLDFFAYIHPAQDNNLFRWSNTEGYSISPVLAATSLPQLVAPDGLSSADAYALRASFLAESPAKLGIVRQAGLIAAMNANSSNVADWPTSTLPTTTDPSDVSRVWAIPTMRLRLVKGPAGFSSPEAHSLAVSMIHRLDNGLYRNAPSYAAIHRRAALLELREATRGGGSPARIVSRPTFSDEALAVLTSAELQFQKQWSEIFTRQLLASAWMREIENIIEAEEQALAASRSAYALALLSGVAGTAAAFGGNSSLMSVMNGQMIRYIREASAMSEHMRGYLAAMSVPALSVSVRFGERIRLVSATNPVEFRANLLAS
jgi:hypothetical protein